MNNKKLVVIPAFNEVKNLDKVISDLNMYAPDFDYVIINDCSTDNTMDYCKEKKYNVVNLPVNLGIGGCVQTGYKYAKNNNYDIVVQFDGDAQHNAQYISLLLEHMQRSGCDMVIGSRFIEKKGFQSSITRRLGINYFTNLIQLLTGQKVTDPTSGFRMVNKNVIKKFCDYYPVDYPEPESIVSILRLGFKVEEVAVLMNERSEGESSINLIKSIYYMIKVTLAILIDTLKSSKR